MDRIEHMRQKQKARQKKFPLDRICFMHGELYANEDVRIIKQYRLKEITMDQACRAIAQNNYLTNVTRDQFKNMLHILGYDRRELYADERD